MSVLVPHCVLKEKPKLYLKRHIKCWRLNLAIVCVFTVTALLRSLHCCTPLIIFGLLWKERQKKTIPLSHSGQHFCTCGCTTHLWFMLVCNWVLIKSVSGAHVIVCFQDPPCVSVCVIGCYRCCECMSVLKDRMDRFQCDCGLKNAFKSTHFFVLFSRLCQEFFWIVYSCFWFTHTQHGLCAQPLRMAVTFILLWYIWYETY